MTPSIHLPTVLFLHQTSLIVAALVLLQLRTRSTGTSGLGLLACAFSALAASYAFANTLHAGSIPLPPNLRIKASVVLAALGDSLLWAGFSELAGRARWKYNWPVFALPLAITAAALATDFTRDPVLRGMGYYVCVQFALLGSAYQVWRSHRIEPLSSRLPLAGCMVLAALVFGLRVVNLVLDTDWILNVAEVFFVEILCNFGLTLLTVTMVNERSQRRLQLMAQTDPLTGVGNRRWFLTQLPKIPADDGALLLIDLDHFKQTNDRFGHAAGDEVLVAFAHYVQSTLRPHDAFARIGGEEFVLYLPAVAAAEAMQVAERLRSGIADLVCVSMERRIPLTASIGVAVANPTDRDWKTTLHRADQALYAAKAAGRNRVELHHPSVPVHGLAS